MIKATFGSASTKKFPAALASLLDLMRALSAAWYSSKYFLALAVAVFLASALAFLASALLYLTAFASF